MNSFRREITKEDIARLTELSRLCRGDIIKMTTVAGSGHPGGSLSSIDMYLTLLSFAKVEPDKFDDAERDRIIISHGHTAPGLYACLARLGFIDLTDLLIGFRHIASPYEGHAERHVPGVEWTTGNLGQGLSAGCGFALAGRLHKRHNHVFVAMSDAEQAKGQVGEARRFARKYRLTNLTVLIDCNHFQISGRTEDIMPVNIKENYLADGWQVLEVSGHDFSEIHQALSKAMVDTKNPYAIICQTTIGKGISFMENQAEYHGRALTREECQKALAELKIEDDIDKLVQQRRTQKKFRTYERKEIALPRISVGKPKIYHETSHPRGVFGNVLEEVAKINPKNLMAVFDCDLADSIHTNKFAEVNPENFFESGVSEHTTATIAGALSLHGIVTIWGDFGVFALDEVYNQLRLNDINNTNLKIVATHLGYNVGADGKTHHCIDYIGLLRNLPGFRLIVPSDPNQTDHMTRFILSQRGNYVLGLVRTKLPVIKNEAGALFYDEKYNFEYGMIDLVRAGRDCAIFTFGFMLDPALSAGERLKTEGINVGIYNITSPLHIDRKRIVEAAQTKLVITYEDHIKRSGIGSAIGQIIAEENIRTRFITMGIREFAGSDNPEELYKKHGLDSESLVTTIKNNL